MSVHKVLSILHCVLVLFVPPFQPHRLPEKGWKPYNSPHLTHGENNRFAPHRGLTVNDLGEEMDLPDVKKD